MSHYAKQDTSIDAILEKDLEELGREEKRRLLEEAREIADDHPFGDHLDRILQSWEAES